VAGGEPTAVRRGRGAPTNNRGRGRARERKGAGWWRSPPHDGASAVVGVDKVAMERRDGGDPSVVAREQWWWGGANGRAKEGFGRGEQRAWALDL
jgi:hypothetical protein